MALLIRLLPGAGVNNRALIRAAHWIIFVHIIQKPLAALTPSGYLNDGLLCDGAGPSLPGVEPLFDREAAAMCLEPFHQQVVDSSEVIVAFVLQRLEEDGQLELTQVKAIR